MAKKTVLPKPLRGITEERARLALEATWQTDALLDAVLEAVESRWTGTEEDVNVSARKYVVRGLIFRMRALNNAVMSILDDDRTDAVLHKLVFDRKISE